MRSQIAGNSGNTAEVDAYGSISVSLSGNKVAEQHTEADGTGGVKEVASLTISAAATVSSNVTVTLNGVATNVAVLSTDTAIQVADKIRAAAFVGWTTGGTVGTTTVTFTANTFGNKTDAAFSAGTTGTTGAMTTTAQGVPQTVTFTKNIVTLEIYNTDATNQGIFNVNGINITVPAAKSFKASFGGTASAIVTIASSASYILTRYE